MLIERIDFKIVISAACLLLTIKKLEKLHMGFIYLFDRVRQKIENLVRSISYSQEKVKCKNFLTILKRIAAENMRYTTDNGRKNKCKE